MTKRSSLRASDADRDRVVERLHQAVSEGRLLAHEFEERLGHTLRARTYGDLDAVVDDLPGGPVGVIPARQSQLHLVRHYPVAVAIIGLVIGIALISAFAAAVMLIASGAWILPIVAFFIFRAKANPGRRRRRDAGLGHMHMHARRYGRF